jgi:uncharacterized membrane protein
MSTQPSGFPWRTLLVVSMSINLLVVGAGIGFVASGARWRPPGFEAQQVQRQPFLRALPEADRQKLLADLGRAWSEGEPGRREAAEARRNLMNVAQQEPYNEAAVREAMAQMRTKDAAVQAKYQDTLAAALGKMAPDQRVQALRAASRPGPLRQGGGPGGGRDGGPFRDGRGPGDGPPPSGGPQ